MCDRRESAFFRLELRQAFKHVLALESHAISLEMINSLGVDILCCLHLRDHLRTVGRRSLPHMALARSAVLSGSKTSTLEAPEELCRAAFATLVLRGALASADCIAPTEASRRISHHHLAG